MAKKPVTSQDVYATTNLSDPDAVKFGSTNEETSTFVPKPIVKRNSRRTITKGPDLVARTSETTSDIPAGTIDIEPETRVNFTGNGDARGLPSFTAAGPGKSASGYDWYDDLRSRSGSPKLGLTCDIPGGTYSHGTGGPDGTHFMGNAQDNPFTSTPYVLCDHHLKLKQIQHAADPNITFTPVRPQDIEKHKARKQAMLDSSRGAFESTLQTGGLSIPLPDGAPKPPKNVVLPPNDLLYGQETAGTDIGVRGAIRPDLRDGEGSTSRSSDGSIQSHLVWSAHSGTGSNLAEANSRRSNLDKEDVLNRALDTLRFNNGQDHDAHLEQYHSENSTEECPTCKEMYTRTADAVADATPASNKAKTNYTFSPKNQQGVLRRPGWSPDSDKPDVRNAAPTEESPARVGQSLPSERATLESVPYGSLEEYSKATLPAHMITGEDSLVAAATSRAVTPLEKFAEERLTKQIGENVDENGRPTGIITGAEDATAELLRKKEAFRQLSPKQQRALGKKGRTKFTQASERKELE
jgi:hypothetical protein